MQNLELLDEYPSIDKHFALQGEAGLLEAKLELPKERAAEVTAKVINNEVVAIICHPDPKQEGTMDNKVVYSIGKAVINLGIPSLKFNYRGVGQSEGEYGQQEGEVRDLHSVVNWLLKVKPTTKLILAGFSFGTYIANRVAKDLMLAKPKLLTCLINVAPSVSKRDYTIFADLSTPWLVVQGLQDEMVDSKDVQAWIKGMQVAQTQHQVELATIEKATHFFHGCLTPLRLIIEQFIKEKV